MPGPQSLLRRWAIPLAALAPTFAIIFAFSLGPSPHKHIADYLRSPDPAAQRLARLDAAGEGIVGAMAERIQEPNLPRRDEAIAYLGRAADRRALPALERLIQADTETAQIRKLAFDAALAIDRRRGLTLAESLANRTDALGEAARSALEHQERSALHP